MSLFEEQDTICREANELLDAAAWPAGGRQEKDARGLLPRLKSMREFKLLRKLAERVLWLDPGDATVRRLQVQAMIETGNLVAAIAAARAARDELAEDHPESGEFAGLLGRAWKQVAIELHPSATAARAQALRRGIEAYEAPYRRDSANSWHGINLAAMLAFAQREGIAVPGDADATAIARRIVADLEKVPPQSRDRWTTATLAEAHLALDDLDAVERHLHDYLAAPGVNAFEVASTLRQFAEVWGLAHSPNARRRGIVEALRTRLMELPGASYRTPASSLLQGGAAGPSNRQLEAILGADGTKSYKWWQAGLRTAASVGAVYAGIGRRHGTGFLVPAAPFGVAGDEPLLLTNFHVVNEDGTGGAMRYDNAWVVFEAVDAETQYRFSEVIWSSPVHRHDACLLRLETPVHAGLQPLPLAPRLPVVEADAKVYIIGHPGGGGLEFSFQDNSLLDHEGPPATARIDGVCRLHYRAPTEKGSSGSPVLNAGEWRVIGLHHAGGTLNRLRDPGSYAANEGISLQSIIAACKKDLAGGD